MPRTDRSSGGSVLVVGDGPVPVRCARGLLAAGRSVVVVAEHDPGPLGAGAAARQALGDRGHRPDAGVDTGEVRGRGVRWVRARWTDPIAIATAGAADAPYAALVLAVGPEVRDRVLGAFLPLIVPGGPVAEVVDPHAPVVAPVGHRWTTVPPSSGDHPESVAATTQALLAAVH